MKILVCGSRSYIDRAHVFAVLDLIHRGASVQEMETALGAVAACQWETAGLAGQGPIHVLVHGVCGVDNGRLGKSPEQDRAEWRKLKGADGLASAWVRARAVYGGRISAGSIRHHMYAADWTRYGPGAGPRRNQDMLEREHLDLQWRPEGPLHLVVAFPSSGPGTRDMTYRARKARVPVLDVPARI